MSRQISTLVVLFVLIPAFVSAAGWAQIISPTDQTLFGVDTYGNDMFAVGGGGNVIRSEDDGLTWELLTSEVDTTLYDVDIVTSSVIVAVGAGGVIVRSTDGGDEWFEVSISGLSGSDQTAGLRAVIFTSSSTGFAVGELGVILKTTNGGGEWESLDSPTNETIRNLMYVSGDLWFVGDKGVIYKSEDKGDSWSPISAGTTNDLYTVRFTNSDDGWVAGEERTLIRTQDGGDTWSDIEISQLNSDDIIYDVSFTNSDDGILSTDNATILETDDGGETWTTMTIIGSAFLRDVMRPSDSEHWGVGDDGAIYRYDTEPPGKPKNFDVDGNNDSLTDPTPEFTWDHATDDETAVSDYMFKIDQENSYESIGAESYFTPDDEIENGDHTAYLYAVDTAGNEGDVVTLNFTMDSDSTETDAPEVDEISPTTAVKEENVRYFARFSNSTPMEDCDIYVNDEYEKNMTIRTDVAYVTLRFDDNGEYELYARCTDENGEKATGRSVTLTVSSGSTHANPGDLIKLGCEGDVYPNDPCTAVYYFGPDGKRHAFTKEAVFKTWYDDFDDLVILSSTALAEIPLGRNVTYRPGNRLVMFSTNTVYAVSYNGILRPIATGQIAESIFGSDWVSLIKGVDDVFYGNYRIGSTIEGSNDFDIDDVESWADHISDTF